MFCEIQSIFMHDDQGKPETIPDNFTQLRKSTQKPLEYTNALFL